MLEMIREVVNGIIRKPFVVNWSEMSPTFNIISKVMQFRTVDQANEFIRTLPARDGFIRINAVYNRDARLGYLRYGGQ